MSETISTMVAQPFAMPAVKMHVSDSSAAGSRDETFIARTCRMFLATVTGGTPGVNSGTEADPDEWIRGHAQRLANHADASSTWSFALQSDGRLKITYNGTGTGTITWDGTGGTSLIPRYLAGFDANVSLGAGASVTGTYQVTHAFFLLNGVANATGWTPLPRRSAIGETDDGLGYAFTASIVRQVLQADWRFIPYDWTTRAAISAAGSPYQPTRTYRRQRPSATPYTTGTVAGDAGDTTHAVSDPPWSLVDVMSTVHGKRCAVVPAKFASVQSGGSSTYYECTFGRECLQGDMKVLPSSPDLDARVDWKGVVLRYVATKSR